MEEGFRRFFLTDADNSSIRWPEEAFKQVYNRYFADEDYFLTADTVTQANLRPLIQTIDIVGDDELELSWPEFVEFQTGFPVRMPGAEVLSFKIGRAGLMTDSVQYIDNTAYAHFRKSFQHSVTKNRLAAQGAIMLMVSGHWSNPLLDGAPGGSRFDVSLLTNRDDWLIRSMDESDTNVGQLTATRASINLFEGGDIYIPDTTDDRHIDVDAGDVDVARGGDTVAANTTISEGARSAVSSDSLSDPVAFWVDSWLGASVLTDINFF